jgi:diacylglycerol O-acyltransferase
MPANALPDRLSFQDSVFIYLEKEDMPLHIGVIEIFDGDFQLKQLQSFIESKLDDVPRYKQKVEIAAMNLAHPRWVPDRRFDIRNHVRRVRMTGGSMADLQELAGRIFSETMDRAKPLWDLTVVDGLADGRTPVIWRVHHCLVDGIAGVELMKAILDDRPVKFRQPRKQASNHQPEPAPPQSLAETILESYSEFAEGLLSIPAAALDLAEALLSSAPPAESLGQWAELLPDLLKPVGRLPFNQQCKGPRRFAFTELEMADIDAIRKTSCGTVNDVVLTALTCALRRYTELHHANTDRLVRIMAPVNTRPAEHRGDPGVNISLIPIDLPLGTIKPAELLPVVHERTQALKRARMAGVFSLASACLSGLPVPLQILTGWVLSNPLPLAPWNLICTNVPGPQETLYMLGRKMVACYPYLPIIPMGNEMGLSVAVYSYDGRMYVGFAGDIVALPDVKKLRDFFDQSYAELKKAVLGRKAAAPPPRKRPVKRVKPEATVEPVAEPAAPEPVVEVQPPPEPKPVAEELAETARA